MKYISWFITLPLLLLGVVFALANRQIVELSLWPLDSAVEVPLYLAVLLPLFAGYILGGVAVWMNAGGKRRVARKDHRELKRMKTDETRKEDQAGKGKSLAVTSASAAPALGQPAAQ